MVRWIILGFLALAFLGSVGWLYTIYRIHTQGPSHHDRWLARAGKLALITLAALTIAVVTYVVRVRPL